MTHTPRKPVNPPSSPCFSGESIEDFEKVTDGLTRHKVPPHALTLSRHSSQSTALRPPPRRLPRRPPIPPLSGTQKK